MSKLNRRIREEQIEKHAEKFGIYASQQHISDYKIARMTPHELYTFIENAMLEMDDNFMEYVLYQVGEAEDYFHHVFSQIRAHIAEVVEEYQDNNSTEPYEEDVQDEPASFAPIQHHKKRGSTRIEQIQALAGWHHIPEHSRCIYA